MNCSQGPFPWEGLRDNLCGPLRFTEEHSETEVPLCSVAGLGRHQVTQRAGSRDWLATQWLITLDFVLVMSSLRNRSPWPSCQGLAFASW